MTNLQLPEGSVDSDGSVLDIQEVFPTIQGEGPLAGLRAVFIRLAGCNLQCPGCDTDYTSARKPWSLPDILSAVNDLAWGDGSLVVITGGEPFRQPIAPLVRLLRLVGYNIQIETNGTLYLPGFPYADVTIVCSPKAGRVAGALWPHITALKYVVETSDVSADDGLPLHALRHPCRPFVARPPEDWNGHVYVQPMDTGDADANARNMHECVRLCMKYGYRLGTQIHKIVGVP